MASKPVRQAERLQPEALAMLEQLASLQPMATMVLAELQAVLSEVKVVPALQARPISEAMPEQQAAMLV